MLEALAWNGVSRHARRAGVSSRAVGFLVSLGAILAVAAVVATAADVSVESLQVGLVAGTSQVDRTTLGLDKGIIGDTVRVSALVRNDAATAVGEFEVNFFFTETISGEHGLLGTQVVSGLEPDEEKRPVVLFDTSALLPGIYAFSAEVDPRNALGDTDLCDNSAPRGACSSTGAEAYDKYALTLLREGRHISRLAVQDPLSTCRMGELQGSITVDVYNVGTEPLSGSDLAVYGYYRLGLTAPANTFIPLSVDASGNPAQLSKFAFLGKPGEIGFIRITLSYGKLDDELAPSSADAGNGVVLGRADSAQIRITVQPADGSGTAQDLYLPEQFELSQFYSTVDLWTFPARQSCCSDCAAVTSVNVAPAVAGGRVFHVARSSTGDTLYVLQVDTGQEKGRWPAPTGKTLTSPVASYDEDAATYRVYVGASDGRIYALEGIDKEEGEFLAALWQSSAASADAVVKGDAHLALSSDKAELIVGSEAGAFVLDTATGQIARRVTNRGAVTSTPAYIDATGELWIAASDLIYRVPVSGSECSYDVGERITTDLVANATGSAVFFGTETGSVFAVGGSSCALLGEDRPLRSVVGIAVATDGDDAVIYLTSDIGEMARAEYDHNRGFSDVTTSLREVEPDVVSTSPALLLNRSGDDASVVFVSGLKRDGRTNRPILHASDRDLAELETVTVWGTTVPFVFKPEEAGRTPAALLQPIVDPEWFVLLVASSDGYLYAFDLSQYE